jgi:tRNA dimethylallyltransferase
MHDEIKLITIAGPTASGKTDLAIQLAEQFDGEIICADSRTIYRGMDIGTAKPTAEERRRVPHHLLDVVDPGETLSVAAFKDLAESAIEAIDARGKVPMLVGGSGLYIDAVLYDYQFPDEANPERRQQLEVMADTELLELLAAEDPEAYLEVDQSNRRRVMRALETAGQRRSKRQRVRPDTLVLGLRLNKEVAQARIQKRIELMLEKGFLNEVRMIGETYGWESEAMSGIGYRAFRDVILGHKTVAEAQADFVRGDSRLMKKQLTWFKRNAEIVWLQGATEAERLGEARRLTERFLKDRESGPGAV